MSPISVCNDQVFKMMDVLLKMFEIDKDFFKTNLKSMS